MRYYYVKQEVLILNGSMLEAGRVKKRTNSGRI